MGHKEPIISVVVPCYNEVNNIEKCLLSIINQNFPFGEFEVLVVDGLSSDGTREIIKKISELYSNIRIVDNTRQITPAAFNLGIRLARGKYISILGAHCEYDKHFLANSIKLFCEHPEISCSGGPLINKGLTRFGKSVSRAMSHPVGIGNARHRFPGYEGYAEGACFPTFKREVFNKLGLYDETLIRNQDGDLNFRLTQSGGKVFISPKVKSIYFVRDTPTSLFKQYFQYGFWRCKVLKKHKKIMSFRQIVPPLFFLSVFILIITGILLPSPVNLLAFFLPMLYLGLLSVVSIKESLFNGILFGANFFLAVTILHCAYALGFIISISNIMRYLGGLFPANKALKVVQGAEVRS